MILKNRMGEGISPFLCGTQPAIHQRFLFPVLFADRAELGQRERAEGHVYVAHRNVVLLVHDEVAGNGSQPCRGRITRKPCAVGEDSRAYSAPPVKTRSALYRPNILRRMRP